MAATASERLGSAFMTDLKCSTTAEEGHMGKPGSQYSGRRTGRMLTGYIYACIFYESRIHALCFSEFIVHTIAFLILIRDGDTHLCKAFAMTSYLTRVFPATFEPLLLLLSCGVFIPLLL